MRVRKFTKKKAAREVFLVICEGETEREYVECLRLHYRLPIAIKTRVAGNALNQRLISQYLSDLGISVNDNYKIFLIYDADVSNMVDKLKKLQGFLILSNPCIELWFMLHVKNYRKSQESIALVKELTTSHPVWRNYLKGHLSNEQSEFLLSHRMEAVARADELTWHNNPSSNMRIFIDALETAKNEVV